jgi:hypothetical protein
MMMNECVIVDVTGTRSEQNYESVDIFVPIFIAAYTQRKKVAVIIQQ